MSIRRVIPIALLALVWGMPVLAEDVGPLTSSVRVARPAASARIATRTLERRIADAAMDVCGASPFSGAEVKAAVARSQCWHDSYAAGIAQIGAPSPADVAALPPPRTTGKP